jgi:hypothetical protein
MIGYYVPLNDPLQLDVKYFLSEIERWRMQCLSGNIIDESPSPVHQAQKPKQPEQSTRQSFNKNQKHY